MSDNGCGIEKDDLKIAFLPHTTSKIKNSDDLNNITTLGFRGEALASICAVSKVSIATKTQDDETAHGIKVVGGEVQDPSDVAGANGTTVVVDGGS